jgi:hypothetical protein
VNSSTAESIDGLPDQLTLSQRLNTVAKSSVKVVAREPFGSGTFPKEIIRCRTPEGGEFTWFCKYAAPRHPAFGHRGGIGYEARVYREILDPLPVTVPRLVGSGGNGAEGAWLILDFLRGERLSEVWSRMPEAASWLGRFHSLNAPRVPDPSFAWLTAYDRDYYSGWSVRTVEYSAGLDGIGSWLAELAEYFEEHLSLLLDVEQTIIHGEFTIHNVMITQDSVYPTDWESAAIGPGEIDLMSLVDRWTPDVIGGCVREYLAGRWHEGTPSAMEERLREAELYLHFRWLGENPDLMLGPKRVWRFGRLMELARQVGAT